MIVALYVKKPKNEHYTFVLAETLLPTETYLNCKARLLSAYKAPFGSGCYRNPACLLKVLPFPQASDILDRLENIDELV